VSDGGAMVAVAEMLIAAGGELGTALPYGLYNDETVGYFFGERPGCYILEVEEKGDVLSVICEENPAVNGNVLGHLNSTGALSLHPWPDSNNPIPVADLTTAWLGTLDN
ncbi:MAG: hypothetical protein AAFY15_15535, partial [Cyanobacteria bacterium J06648_11]